MKSKDYVLTTQYNIDSDDADFTSKVKVRSLINFFIQGAWKHAEELKWGYSHLSENGLGWVLSRFTVEFYSFPTWPGTITLKTWPKGLNRLFYLRDTKLFNNDNKKIAGFTSAWLIIDMKSKRPKLIDTDIHSLYANQNQHAINKEIPALKFSGQTIKSQDYTVRYNDIDVNQHLTTVRYIDFMFDPNFIAVNTPKSLSVNFLKEIKHGTEVRMDFVKTDKTYCFELINISNNMVCFRGEIMV